MEISITNVGFALCNFTSPKGAKGEVVRLPFGALKVSDVLEPTQRWLDDGHVVKREGQILVVIDEAQITFSNRDWNAPGRMEWIRFFIQHRKLGMRVILVVQDLGMIDKQIRAVVETTGNHMKVNSLWGRSACWSRSWRWVGPSACASTVSPSTGRARTG